MFMRVGVPLLILLIIAGIVLFCAVLYRRRHEDLNREEELAKWIDAEHPCHAVDPIHGWICEREENHYNKHWQITDGVKHSWS